MICIECQGPILGRKKGARYCSPQCTSRAGVRRHRAGDSSHADYGYKPAEEDSIYAVLFVVKMVLKVGFAKGGRHSLGGTRQAALRNFGLDEVVPPLLIWRRPGDFRMEMWIQANLNYRYPWPKEAKTRASEWYDVQGAQIPDIVQALDGFYESAPLYGSL